MADIKLVLVGLCLVAGLYSPIASASSTRPTTLRTEVSSSTTNTANVTINTNQATSQSLTSNLQNKMQSSAAPSTQQRTTQNVTSVIDHTVSTSGKVSTSVTTARSSTNGSVPTKALSEVGATVSTNESIATTTVSSPLSHTTSIASNNSDSISTVPTPVQTANQNVTSDNETFTPSGSTTSVFEVLPGSNRTLSTISASNTGATVSSSTSATAAANVSSTTSTPADNSSSTIGSDHHTLSYTTETTPHTMTVPSANASVTKEPYQNLTTSATVSNGTAESVNNSTNKTTVANIPTPTATSSANATKVTVTPISTEETTVKNDTGLNTTGIVNTTTTLSPSTSISTPSVFNVTKYSTVNTSATTNASVTMTTPSVVNVTVSDVNNVTGTDLGNFTSTVTGNMTSTENYTSTEAQLPGNTTESVVTGVGPVTRTTTHKPWEPPEQTGTFGPDSSNLTIILIPCLAILILSVIAILIFIMCKRARKNARRTRAPEEQKKAGGAATQYGTGSPFITSPYRSGEDPRTAGSPSHDNIAYDRDDPKADPKTVHDGNADKRYKNGDAKKEISTSDKKPADQSHLARYDRLKDEESSNAQNGLHSTVKFEKMKTEDEDIELGNIVIESDPDDSNRYFKKADLGDWYRLVMKGKRPKDTETLLDKNDTGDKSSKHGKDKHRHEREKHRGDTEKHKTHSSQEEKFDEHSRRQHRRKSRDKYDTKDRSKSPHKRHHRSSERELSSSLPKPSSSKGAGKDRLAASLPLDMSSSKIQNMSKSGHTSPVKMAQPPQSKLIMSNPVMKDANASQDKCESKVDQSKPDTKDAAVSQAAVPKTRLIMSQPKTATRTFPDGNTSETGKTVDIVSDDKKKTPVNISQGTTDDGKTAAKSQSQRRPEIVPRLNLTKS